MLLNLYDNYAMIIEINNSHQERVMTA